jgi:hypothetical protein
VKKQRHTNAMIVAVRSVGRALEIFADFLDFFFERKLSFREAILATFVILATLFLTVYILGCNGCAQSGRASHLILLRNYVDRDLQEYGGCVLADVRERWEKGWTVQPPRLLWTDLKFVSNRGEYEGELICCYPRSDFGAFATFTTGLALKRDTETQEYCAEIVYPRGRPDFIRLPRFVVERAKAPRRRR